MNQVTLNAFLDEMEKISGVASYARKLPMFHPTAVAKSPVLSKLNPAETSTLKDIFAGLTKKKPVPGDELMKGLSLAKAGKPVHIK